MASDHSSERKILAQALAPGKDCPPIERFEVYIYIKGGSIPLDLARHLESCAYCRTELELLRSFHTEPRDEAEAEAILMVAERLQSARLPIPATDEPWWRRVFQVRWWSANKLSPALMAAACVLIAVAAGIQWRNSAGHHLYVTDRSDPEILRSGAIKIISPSGDIRAIPAEIKWEPVPGAAQYRISVLEVDHTELWTATTSQDRLGLPTPVKARIVPAKTILVQVVSFDGAGRKLAESDFVPFRLLQTIYNH